MNRRILNMTRGRWRVFLVPCSRLLDCSRFYITPGLTPDPGNGTSIDEVNMGEPATLVSFVKWAVASYLTTNYALALWNHGCCCRATQTVEDGKTVGCYDT